MKTETTIQVTAFEQEERKIFQQRYLTMRADIAKLVADVRTWKPQRCTVRFKGERTVQPGLAASLVATTGQKLRCLYIVFGELRGKTAEVHRQKPHRVGPNPAYLEAFRNKYLKDPIGIL